METLEKNVTRVDSLYTSKPGVRKQYWSGLFSGIEISKISANIVHGSSYF